MEAKVIEPHRKAAHLQSFSAASVKQNNIGVDDHFAGFVY